MLKMHKLRPLSYVADTDNNLTLCWRHVDRNQIAAFDEGVTCKKCLAIVAFNTEEQQRWDANRAAQKASQSA